MSEELILKMIQNLINGVEEYGFDFTFEECVVIDKNEYNAIQGLLDLYNQEKEKNKELREKLEITFYTIKKLNNLLDSKQKDFAKQCNNLLLEFKKILKNNGLEEK